METQQVLPGASKSRGPNAGFIKGWIQRLLFYLPLSFWALFTIFGLLWIVVTSFKTNRELYSNVWSLPTTLQIQNYIKAWDVVKMGQYFSNSLIVVFSSIILNPGPRISSLILPHSRSAPCLRDLRSRRFSAKRSNKPAKSSQPSASSTRPQM